MAAKPDAEKGSFLRHMLTFLGTSTGLVLVCVVLNVSGVVKWKDLVELLHGGGAGNTATKVKNENTPTAGMEKSGTGKPPPGKTATTSTQSPVDAGDVVRPNTAPRLTAKTDVVAFSEGERTRIVEITVEDEDVSTVNVALADVPIGLMPHGGAKLSGAGKTRFLEVTIDPNKWGNAMLRLTGTDRAGLTAETTIKVMVPAPALSVAEIPDVAVAVGEPIAMIPIMIEDKALTQGKVTVSAISTDRLFTPEGLKLDMDGKRLQLLPIPGKHGAATVTIIAQADGRETRRSFKVTVKPQPPYETTVLLSLPSGALDLDMKGLNKVQDAPALDKGTTVKVTKIVGKRAMIEWTVGGKRYVGWIDTDILTPVE